MRSLISSFHFLLLIVSVTSQQIWDIWQTTWDRQKLFTRWPTNNGLPINFGTPGPAGSADIVIEDTEVFQTMDGFGASLITKFWKLLESSERTIQCFPGAGLTTLRLPIGASDFSANAYSWDDTWDDTTLSTFSANVAPNYVWSTLQDIMSISPIVKIFALPWSPPAWMKSTSSMLGGNLDSSDVSIWANYLLKSVQALESKGFTPYAIGIQNEPQNSNPTYPTALVNVSLEAQVGLQLRTLLNNNGFSNVKIVGYEHNWDDATAYPVQLMQAAGSAFDGVAFHCYAGSVSGQSSFHNAYPSKDIFQTECTGTLGTDWWSNIKWYMDNLFVGSPENWGRTAMMWNLALDPNGNPILPGSSSCGGGCRGVVTISNGQYSVNEEYYVMAQTSRALIPKDAGGPFGQRIGVTVNGNLNWALRVGAYQTGRANPSDPDKWSIVVLNWQDNDNGTWDPQPVAATIEFRGQQASFTFPVGVTTLWWYA